LNRIGGDFILTFFQPLASRLERVGLLVIGSGFGETEC
jgi:hypothetical protein